MRLQDLCLDWQTDDEVKHLIALLKKPRKKFGTHGMLLYGATGVGKMTLARIIASEEGYDFIEECASNFVNSFQDSGAEGVHAIFRAAQQSERQF